MPRSLARPLLHTLHLATFVLLMGTGILMLSPELRAVVTGGYSLLIFTAHCWGGVAFLLLPVAVLVAAGGPAVLAPAQRDGLRGLWQAGHMLVTVTIGTALVVSGFALWAKDFVSMATMDASLLVHDWLTYAAAALVALHLLELAGRGAATRVQEARALQPPSSKLSNVKED
jgi:cytochrome b subunit of formate dehydrogenase